ncbi:MAG: substrate-binding domain-containing protein [Spirochaetales bacterium]|nr:substrate-binding domain-containing protein [Spirochaetales bacterium]
MCTTGDREIKTAIKNYKNKTKTRITIGFLTDFLYDRYQVQIFNGVVRAAQENDTNLLTFCGGSLKNPTVFPIYRNYIFNLIDPSVLNGLLVLSGPIANFITPEEMAAFLARFKPLPIVCIGLPIKPFSCIQVDNFQGMYDLTEHLINTHNCKKIGFISGNTTKNMEARLRFQGYKKALADHKLSFQPELVFHGDFCEGTGKTAARYFIERPGCRVNAVIASNDLMAYDALDELQARNISIPEDLILVGFDNTAERQLSYPSLTTAAQPLFKLGYQGLESIVHRIKHGKEIASNQLKVNLIIRRSCGCRSRVSRAAASIIPTKNIPTANKQNRTMKNFLKAILQTEIGFNFSDFNKRKIIIEWADRIATCITQAVNKKFSSYFTEMEKVLIETYSYKQSVLSWRDVIETTFQLLQKSFFQHQHAENIEQLKNYTYEIISEIHYSILNRKNRRIYQQLRQIDLFSRIIITSFSLQAFKSRIKQNLSSTGLTCCYIVKLRDQEFKSAEVLTYFNLNNNPTLKNKPFKPPQLLPGGINNHIDEFNLIVLPLNFEHEKIGFVLLSHINDFEESLYEILANQLSTALKTVQLVERELTYSQDLETEVIKRTADLRRSLKEKNVLLMEIHHRVKNNLQIISSLLNLQSSYSKQKKFVDVFTAAKNRIRSMSIIYEKLYKSKDLAHINLKEYITVLVNTLLTTFNRKGKIKVELNIDSIQLSVDKAIPCGLIINELVTNSIKHAFNYHTKGSTHVDDKIYISIRIEKRKCELIISDNGKGMPEDFNIHKTRTLGLELVSLLTEGQLNGKVSLHVKNGTSFTIIFNV